jgi:UDP-3-O-[3-hydroxymyristoyl] glucosamine N-acyltransferase
MIDHHFYTISPARSLQEICDRLGVVLPVEGAADEMIDRPAGLGVSEPGCLTFFSDKKRKAQLGTAKATACLTTEKLLPFVAETGMIGLVVKNPRAAFARLSAQMVRESASETGASAIDTTAKIHPSATIGSAVSIGSETVIGANCVIEDGVTIGSNCVIEPLVRVCFTRMGNNCQIKSGAIIGGAGFGVVEDETGIFNVPHFGRVMIHDNVSIGSNSCIDRGQLGDTVLSDDVKIDNLVQIGHNVFIGEGTRIAGQSGISGSCVIGKKCLLGGGASLADHITLGDGAIIAAYAGIMADVPAGEMYSGIPAMPVREHMRNVATLKKLAKRK